MVSNFLDFLVSLAPEGETALIVRQKPQLKDGQMQFHPDGAIKCTWPSYLPDMKRIKPDQAWYGNTASFIIDRFANGRVSAAINNKRRGIAVPRLIRFDPFDVRQIRRPCALDRTVWVKLHLAVLELRFLPDKQRRFALGSE